MRYSQLVGAERSIVVSEPTPPLRPSEVLVEVELCGVCASELHRWMDGPGSQPRRLGHEPVGIVRAVGEHVADVGVGDRVTGLFKGAYSDLCVALAGDLLRVPDGVATEAALGEPLACLVNAQRRTLIDLADIVALIGLGYMGLGMLQLLKLRGPGRIIAIDVREDARAAAKRYGANEVFHPAEVPGHYRVTRFADWQTSMGVDVAIEASGTQAGLTLAGEMVRAHGVLSILGFHQGGPRTVDMEMWNRKAIDVVNAHVRRKADLMESMRIGLELLAAQKLDLASLVTHRFPVDSVDEAFTALRAKPEGYIKAVVTPQWTVGRHTPDGGAELSSCVGGGELPVAG